MGYHPQPDPNPFWARAAWFIDPVAGDDDNDGATAATPVKSFNGGVVARWGTNAPTLRQNTTITWISSQPVGGADPVFVQPLCMEAVLMLVGQLPAATHAGALAGVVAKNRATGQLLTADLSFAATRGQLVRNTTAGKDSFAWVYSNVAGTTFTLTQPVAPYAFPQPEISATVEVDTWANGDTFEVYDLVRINLVSGNGNAGAFIAPGFDAPLQAQHLWFESADGVDSDNNCSLANAALVECTTNCVADDAPDFASDFISTANNVLFQSSVTSRNDQWVMVAGAVFAQFVGCRMPWTFGYDVIVDNSAGSGFVLGGPMGQGNGIPAFQEVYIAGTIKFQDMFSCAQVVGVTTKVWGPGTLDGSGSARLIYAAANTAVGTFLNAGGLRLNGQANASPYDPATATWAAPIAITAANLDAAFGAPGFGGLAVNVGGASISDQGIA